ncbi:hypothetical protein LTS08_005095 [Lithohypha guttulata]|nr:hypothetical protein LTS08_005095 [Lithohypha guttulata]
MAYHSSSSFGEALAKLRPAVRLTLPPLWFFNFPPSIEPRTLPPPPNDPTLAHPFTIPIDIYNKVLNATVPVTIALIYITTVTFLNSVNKRRGYRPWAFSKTRFFKLMVITHNIVLSLYSAWTFVGMLNALKISLYSPWEPYGLAGTVDSLCKINGPRGVGSAARYNPQTSTWGIANRIYHLGTDTNPDATDVGRMWNEGLAFYGWLFYMSKFYEVIDTLIIIAKGKKSSFLQTYHHAGAMICMWAGIRYMSPPIWVFVLVNSFVHSIMYTFYLFTAIGVKVPSWFKRTLTTLQITQFVLGASYAFLHLFIKYQSPISVPYSYHLGSAATAIASDVSSVASAAVATASADLGSQIKKILLRAAGREGLAENVHNNRGQLFGIDAVKAAQDEARREEIRYRDELDWTHCLDTSGQAFGIYLNVLYLAPLTWLFVRFFIKSYLQRLERRRSSTASQKANIAYLSVRDAQRGVDRRLSQAFEDAQGGEETGDESAIIDEEFEEELKVAADKTKDAVSSAAEKANREIKSTAESTQQTLKNAKTKVENSPAAESASQKINSLTQSITDTANRIQEEVKAIAASENEDANHALDVLKQKADSLKTQAENASQAGKEKAEEAYQSVKEALSKLTADAPDREQVKEEASKAVNSTASKVKEGTDAAVEKGKEVASTTKETAAGKLEESAQESTSKDQSGQKSDSSSSNSGEKDSTSNKPQANSDSAADETQTNETSNKESDKSKPADATKREGDDSNKEEDQKPAAKEQELTEKEKVRDVISDKDSKAEASTGDAKKSAAAARKSKARQSSEPNTSNEPKQKEQTTQKEKPSVEDDESSSEAPGGSLDKVEGSSPIQENSEGRQQYFHQEREDAIKKLDSTKDEETDVVVPEETEDKTEDDHKDESKESEVKSADAETKEESPSFEETRAQALEKLKSASSESNKPDTQDYEDQKESWIQVDNETTPSKDKNGKSTRAHADDGDSDQPTFADIVKQNPEGSENDDAQDTAESKEDQEAKAEEDKIIDESETLRDDVKPSASEQDTANEGGKDSKSSTSKKAAEAGA